MEIFINDMPDSISTIPNKEFNVKQINLISKLHKKERQESKAPSFALT